MPSIPTSHGYDATDPYPSPCQYYLATGKTFVRRYSPTEWAAAGALMAGDDEAGSDGSITEIDADDSMPEPHADDSMPVPPADVPMPDPEGVTIEQCEQPMPGSASS